MHRRGRNHSSRGLSWPAKTLDAAQATLKRNDRLNAAHARYLGSALTANRALDGRSIYSPSSTDALPARIRTAHELVVAGIAMQPPDESRVCQAQAEHAAHHARILR